MCGKCLETAVSGGRRTCPVDRSFLDITKPARNLALQAVIHKLDTRCPNRSGCTWTGPLEHLHKHKGECPMAMVNCSNKDCAAMVYQYEMAAHQLKCPHKSTTCAHCDAKIKVIDMANHQDNCPKMTIVCPNNCDESILRYNLFQKNKAKKCIECIIIYTIAYVQKSAK